MKDAMIEINFFYKMICWISKINNRLLRKALIFSSKAIYSRLSFLGICCKCDISSVFIKVPINHTSVFWSVLVPSMNRNLGRIAIQVAKSYPQSTIIDVGANVGDTWAILRGANISNPILAIEGDSNAIPWLKINTSKDIGIKIYEGFVGVKDARLSFLGEDGATSGKLVKGASDDKAVSLLPLDSIVENCAITKVGLIKVDTDGYDTQIIRTADAILKRDCPVIFMEVQPFDLLRNENIPSFFDYLLKIQYSSFICWDNQGRYVCDGQISSDLSLLCQLFAYFHGSPGMPFLDVAIFHERDSKLKYGATIIERQLSADNFDIAHKQMASMDQLFKIN